MFQGTLFVGSDHGGFQLKESLVARAAEAGIRVENLGTGSEESVDYPRYAAKVCSAVLENPGSLGLLICGTGIGMSIAANKVSGIRAALCSEPYSSGMARRHNDANVLCMGGRVVGPELAWLVLETFLETPYEGGRHDRRLALMAAIEQSGPDAVESGA